MHSMMESEYAAATAWLNSIGDDDGTDEDQYESTVASSPSELANTPAMSLAAPSNTKTMHASEIRQRPISKPGEKGRKEPVVTGIVVDRRMKGDYRSGCRGVSWNRRMQAWLAFWMDGNTRRSKTFSSKIHGFEDARLLAVEFISQKRRENKQAPSSVDESTSSNIPVVETSRRLQRRKGPSA